MTVLSKLAWSNGQSLWSLDKDGELQPRVKIGSVDWAVMGKRKYPDEFVGIINFETGTTDFVPESKEGRARRLRRNNQYERRAALAEFRAVADWELVAALGKAYELLHTGKCYPIHFDVHFRKGSISTTERYTLVNALLPEDLYKRGEEVNAKSVHLTGRAPEIPPDFVHEVVFPDQ